MFDTTLQGLIDTEVIKYLHGPDEAVSIEAFNILRETPFNLTAKNIKQAVEDAIHAVHDEILGGKVTMMKY